MRMKSGSLAKKLNSVRGRIKIRGTGQSRERMRDEFYEGKLWKDELEGKLMPILEKYDIVIVEAEAGLGEWQ